MKESSMTDLTNDANAEPTLTIGDTTYPISGLTDEVKEMLSLHNQAFEMATAAKRQAVIHDIAVANIASMIEKKVLETEE
jgi:hypothetical protein|tara:strand:- start:665 stop:904 length:240 start_codon:yes stop_codon:yes gene_type:complete